MRAARRRPLVVIATTLASFLIGLVLVLGVKDIYQSDARLYVDVRGNDSALQQSDGLLTNYYRNLPTSDRVLTRAFRSLGWQPVAPAILRRMVTSESLKGTNIVVVHAQASTATRAADLANAIAVASVEQNRLDAAERSQQTRQYLQDELTRLTGAIAKVPVQPLGSQDPALAAQLAILQSQYAATYGHLQDLSLEQSRTADALTILERAKIPTGPQEANPRLYLAGAALAGLLAGTLFALILDRLDGRLRTGDDLARAINSPLVLVDPPNKRGAGLDPFEMALALALAGPGAQRILVAATSEYGGADETGVRLAQAAMDSGRSSVLLLTTAIDSGAQAENLRNGSRVTVVLADSAIDARSKWDRAKRFDLAILVIPSPQTHAIGLALARDVDSAILVAIAGRTRIDEARRAAQLLRETGGVKIAAGMLLSRNKKVLAARDRVGDRGGVSQLERPGLDVPGPTSPPSEVTPSPNRAAGRGSSPTDH